MRDTPNPTRPRPCAASSSWMINESACHRRPATDLILPGLAGRKPSLLTLSKRAIWCRGWAATLLAERGRRLFALRLPMLEVAA